MEEVESVIEDLIEIYATLVAENPFKTLAVVLAALVLIGSNASRIDTVEQQTEDLLPDSIASVAAFETLGKEFSTAGGTRYTVLVETGPSYANSTEPRDVRDPAVIRYLMSASNDISRFDRVSSISTPGDFFQKTPSTKAETREVLDRAGEEQWSQFISRDYTAARIQVLSSGLSSEEQDRLATSIRNVMESHDKPPGVRVSYTGDVYINQAFQRESEQTQGFTTLVSLVGVLVVVVVLFRSVANGLFSLLGLIFGIIAGLGTYGLLGLNFSPATSGAISIGIGIAIDFGIQVVSRYREETQGREAEEALQETLKGVLSPMSVALVAALIGFSALSAGRITFLGELGTVLSLTTFFAYVGAVTLIPAAMVIYDRRINPFVRRVKP